MFDSSVIRLSKKALVKNLRFIRKVIGQEVKISSVIKGNAYGHGISTFVPLAEECGIDHFSVFDASEAYRAKMAQTRPGTELMIMGFMDDAAVEWAVENGVSYYVFDLLRLQQSLKYAKKIGKPALIHLELETGLNRTGLHDNDLTPAVQIILENPALLNVVGVCTHFAGAESIANFKRIQDQITEFDRLCKNIENMGLVIPLRHAASSASSLTNPETRFDMVRVGIVQYGYWPSKETEMWHLLDAESKSQKKYSDPLKRVLNWSSKVMHVFEVNPGEFVGYGTSYISSRRMTLATVPIGYSDGFRRSLSNLGRVLIKGKRLNVIGLVNMSMIIVDVTSVPDVQPNDEAVIIGKQKNAHITVGSFSDMSNLVNYEMLVRLPGDIPRVVVE